MSARKSFSEINEKIAKGEAVVVTAEEVIGIVEEEGLEKAAEKVDVVTTATFGPMCSSGAVLNFGHSEPPMRMEKITLNDVGAYGGLAAVDTYLGATAESSSQGMEYGGAHVICDLIEGKSVRLKAESRGTDCYPRKNIETDISLAKINEAYLFNPRNCYQNYAAAVNTSARVLKTYLGVLQPEMGNVNYCSAGELSPLLNDPLYRTIGIGTRIFLAGAQGYVAWQGTQFKSAAARDEEGRPLGPAGTLAVTGDMKKMDRRYISPAVFDGYGVSMFVGIGIPIPVLDVEMMKFLSVSNKELSTEVFDYSVESRNRPSLGRYTYEELRSGSIEIDGRKIRTAPISSLSKAREIAGELKKQVAEGRFLLSEPVQKFPRDNSLNSLEIKEGE